MSRLIRTALAGSTGLVAAAALAAPALALPAADTTPTPTDTAPATTTPATTTPGTPGATATPAAYRYWVYYALAEGEWKSRDTGPYQVTPPDGAVEGWRYATAATVGERTPRATPGFEDLCGKIPAEAGKKRVGVVVDYGRPADGADGANPPAPIARCALVPTNASGSQVLAHAIAVRDEDGMVCGIDNYPAQGCSEALPAVSEAAAAPDEPITISVSAPRDPGVESTTPEAQESGPSKRVLTGVALVIVAAAGGGAWFWRRRQSQGG